MPRIFAVDDPNEGGELGRAIGELQRMIEEGRSFSGNEPNCIFLNTRGDRFATVSAASGLDFDDDGRALASVDWDHDGDLDLWLTNRNGPRVRFMRNDGASGTNFISFQLTGDGKQTSCDAIGARVEVTLTGGEKKLVRTLRAGEGFLSQSAKQVHFGLGTANEVQSVTVRWPGGDAQEFQGLEINKRWRLVQGKSAAEALKSGREQRQLALKPQQQKANTTGDSMRIPLVALLPMPAETTCVDFDNQPQSIPYGKGKPTLIVMYGSWCELCRTELKELVASESHIRNAGLEIVALAIDGIDESSPAEAEKLCRHLEFPFMSARATPEFAQLMTGYHHQLVQIKKPLPIPCSFLVDGDGQLSVIYKGPVQVEQLLKDIASSPETLADRWRRAAPLPGRMLSQESLFESLRHREANTLSAMGIWFNNSARYGDAAKFFDKAIRLQPDFGAAHEGLAIVCDRTQQYKKAVEHYIAAIKLNPEKSSLHYNLGNIYGRFERMKEAETCYRRAVSLKADYKEAHMNLGVCLMQRRVFGDAVKRFEKVLELDPGFVPAKQLLQQTRKLASGP